VFRGGEEWNGVEVIFAEDLCNNVLIILRFFRRLVPVKYFLSLIKYSLLDWSLEFFLLE
jgi:hypothetical protein